ncbi:MULTISPECIES: flagellar type III secretion system pore protein FliP [unclassified Clostridioides]|uniref:flagellar type III secretion system pore protein FliP n=1 Tax=unclassified Clostridioides TaxID=2635829 RepID=UPI00038D67D4|nr:flagellar biosynthetic protein FliP [Clostridioides difficile CD160]MCC0644131.1 flagellar type III secretion system pore protein FliP [Clostridioides sp. ZZV14-6150]MCC0668266.1 flagellar type III secretion system pore protein FliP [Clostridioides sp. ZZV14-6153]MCC0722561.1 flagellar type III secretion system pore protein FliP [Clostridioides sp. ZZV14-6104]MCC0743302.1 flagellar type III secretion system pore protein FliP [Clostridioides sp. ZZV14-6044]MCC0751485.1 flagellar type III sec
MELLSKLPLADVPYTSSMQLFLFLTALMFLPFVMFMMTSFVRIVISLSFLKSALGAQQAIPSQVLVGLAIVLTIFIMRPVLNEINEKALQPYIKEEITMEKAMKEAEGPIKEFLLKQTRQTDLDLFVEQAGLKEKKLTRENIPLSVVVPAFAISELKTAFQIGFLIYIPFLIIDLVVASVLMSMGMFMLPPVMISLPFKLLLFVMVDGWNLIVKTLILGFG